MSEKISNPIDKIRVLLYNFDLEITNAEGQLAIERAKIEKNYDRMGKVQSKNYLLARIEEEKLIAYIKNLKKAKDDVFRNVDNILSLYIPKYKKIWMQKYISGMSAKEIAEVNHYGIDNVKRILRRLRNDLIQYKLIDELIDEEEVEEDECSRLETVTKEDGNI